jgi:hypothetical protein
MGLFKAPESAASDPILTRLAAEDKVSELRASYEEVSNYPLGAMVQEAQLEDHVSLAVPLLHGCRDDFRF